MLPRLIICQCSGQNLMKFFIQLLLCLVFIVSLLLVLKKRKRHWLATPEPLRGSMSKYLVQNSGDQTSINQNQCTVVVKVKRMLKKMLIKVMFKANQFELIMRKVQVLVMFPRKMLLVLYK